MIRAERREPGANGHRFTFPCYINRLHRALYCHNGKRPNHAARLPRAISFACRIRRGAGPVLPDSSARHCCSRASRRHPRSSAAATAWWCGRRTPSPADRSASSSVSACDSTSCGLPAELPSGKSENRKRGTAACSTMSLAHPITTVGCRWLRDGARPAPWSGGTPGSSAPSRRHRPCRRDSAQGSPARRCRW